MSASKSATERELGKFKTQDLITALNTGRIMYNGKECQANWHQGFSSKGTVLDEKTKTELATAFADNNKQFAVVGQKTKTIPKNEFSVTFSGNMSAAEVSKDPFFGPMFSAANSAAAAITAASQANNNSNVEQYALTILDMSSPTMSKYTISITALAPNQQPLLNGVQSAAAPASAAAKPSK